MSIHPVLDEDDIVVGYRVRWRPDPKANPKSKTFKVEPGKSLAKVEKAAQKFEGQQIESRDNGTLDTARGKQTLEAFGTEYRIKYAMVEHSKGTRKVNASLWNNHVLPHLGHLRLATLCGEPERIQDWKAKLVEAEIGDAALRKTIAILSAVMQVAVEWRRIPYNPVAAVKKPSGKRKRHVKVFAPITVEDLRSRVDLMSATLMLVLAYCGLRPGEALALLWSDILERTILIDKAIALGEEKDTKTLKPRSVELPPTVRAELMQWKRICGASDADLVFPDPSGFPWNDSRYRNWRSRVWQVAAVSVGLGTITVTIDDKTGRRSRKYSGPRPYDLRHSAASLLLRKYPDDMAKVAVLMGHSIAMLLETYAHVIAELEGQPRVDIDTEIKKAQRATKPRPRPVLRTRAPRRPRRAAPTA